MSVGAYPSVVRNSSGGASAIRRSPDALATGTFNEPTGPRASPVGPDSDALAAIPGTRSLGVTSGRLEPLDHKAPGQLLDVHPRDGPADDEPLDLGRPLEDGEDLIGLSGRMSRVPF